MMRMVSLWAEMKCQGKDGHDVERLVRGCLREAGN